MAAKKKVVLEIRPRSVCGDGHPTYFVLSTVNCFDPQVGSVISREEASEFADRGIDIVVKNPKRK